MTPPVSVLRRKASPARRRRDRGNAEIIGFILMFGIAALAVDFALQTMLTAREASDDLTTFATMSQIGDAVANHMTRASTAASIAPNATFTILMTLPEGPGGFGYTVLIDSGAVIVDSPGLDASVTRELPALDEVRVLGKALLLVGRVGSNDGVVAVEYRWDLLDPGDPNDDLPTIELKDV